MAMASCDDRTSNKNIQDDSTAAKATRDREILEGDSIEQNENTGQGRGAGAVGRDTTIQDQ